MKKLLPFLLLSLCVAISARAQLVPAIDGFPLLPGKVTIVRTVNQDNTLIYAQRGAGGYMVLYDHAYNQALQFALPSNVQITDMEVYNGINYFCAMVSVGGANYPLVGQFNIMGVFYSGDVVHYCPVTTWCQIGFPVLLTQVSRMTVYDDGSNVYILGVGYGMHNYTEPTPYWASTMFSTFLDVNGFWNFCVDYNKEHRYRYIDIDCTDDYIGVAAVDENDSALLLENPKSSRCFFIFENEMRKHGLGERVENEQIRITGMDANRFTVAYQPIGQTYVECVQLPMPFSSPLQKTSTLSSSTTAVNDWRLLDFRYSSMTDYVLLVGKMAFRPYDVLDNWILGYEWTGGTFRSWNTPVYGQLNSVDEHTGSSLFIATGLQLPGANLMFSSEDIASPVLKCVDEQPVYGTPAIIDSYDIRSNHDKTECSFLDDVFLPEIEEVKHSRICK